MKAIPDIHLRVFASAELTAALKEINLTARVLSITRPELEATFQLRGRMNDQELLSAARAFLREAQPLESQFISQDHAEGFLTALSEKIGRFEGVTTERQRAVETRVVARGAIERGIDRGMELLQKLDRVIENKYRRDDEAQSRWRQARHITRQRRVHQEVPAPALPQAEPMKA